MTPRTRRTGTDGRTLLRMNPTRLSTAKPPSSDVLRNGRQRKRERVAAARAWRITLGVVKMILPFLDDNVAMTRLSTGPRRIPHVEDAVFRRTLNALEARLGMALTGGTVPPTRDRIQRMEAPHSGSRWSCLLQMPPGMTSRIASHKPRCAFAHAREEPCQFMKPVVFAATREILHRAWSVPAERPRGVARKSSLCCHEEA